MTNIAVPDVLQKVRAESYINTASTIQTPKKKAIKRFAPVMMMTILLIAVLIPLQIFVFSFDTAAAATLTVDINPSISLDVNSDGNVVSAEGLNEDGIEILKKLKLRRKSVEDAIEMILEASDSAGYDDSTVSYAVTAENETLGNSLKNKVEERTRAYYAKKNKQGHIVWNNSQAGGNGNGQGNVNN